MQHLQLPFCGEVQRGHGRSGGVDDEKSIAISRESDICDSIRFILQYSIQTCKCTSHLKITTLLRFSLASEKLYVHLTCHCIVSMVATSVNGH